MRISLIIAAGGSGTRFNSGTGTPRARFKNRLNLARGVPVPGSKLFAPLAGKAVLAHSLETFQKISRIREIIIAHPRGARREFQKLISVFKFKKIKLVTGGKTRSESVLNALRKSHTSSDWIMVHDGARLLISQESLKRLFQSANGAAGFVLAKKVVPTLKQVDSKGRIQKTVDRSFLYEAETPQLVRRQLLVEAYKKNPHALMATDEAALLESLGESVQVVTHEGWNPKITTAEDLKLAEAYLMTSHRAWSKEHGASMPHAPSPMQYCVGLGRDTHRLVAGRKFYLGGVRIPFHKGPLGHSDGDALIHAIGDAVLGALGAGDIGDWFSDKNPKYKNARSEKFLKAIVAETKKKKFEIAHVDSVIILEKPRLGKIKERIRQRLARMLSLPKEDVSIKAKTAEGLGPEGEGLAVTCEAIVTVHTSEVTPPRCEKGKP